MPRHSYFEKRLKQLPEKIWSRIAKIDELKGQWISGAKLNPQILGRLKKSVLITSTGASTRIEGASLSDEDIEKLMRGIYIQRFPDRDKGEVKGYYKLLQIVFEQFRHIHFSENSIKHFHKELLQYVEKDQYHLGDYKKLENKVEMLDSTGKAIATIFETTSPYLTAKETSELIEWSNEMLKSIKSHPLLVIGNFIVEFLKIHPFQDGNGRLSRILTNLLLLHAGYLYMPYVSHEKLIEDNKSNYYVALRKSQKTFGTNNENIVEWLNFFLTIILKQSEMAVALLSKENIEKLLSPKQMAVWRYMQTVVEASPMQISKSACVARPTVNQALDKLLRLKKIERLGLGRTTRYRKIPQGISLL